jgi:large subunit ribosomal protein L20
MTRVKRGNVAIKRRDKTFTITQGFRGASSKLYRTANQQKIKALQYSYRDRRQKKRIFRSLWIARINGAARLHRKNYNAFIEKLKTNKIKINRKIFAQLVIFEHQTFSQFIYKFK